MRYVQELQSLCTMQASIYNGQVWTLGSRVNAEKTAGVGFIPFFSSQCCCSSLLKPFRHLQNDIRLKLSKSSEKVTEFR